MFEEMMGEEATHRTRLIEKYRQRFGEHIPLIRRGDVKGFLERKPVWLVRPLGINTVRKQAEIMRSEERRVGKEGRSRGYTLEWREKKKCEAKGVRVVGKNELGGVT